MRGIRNDRFLLVALAGVAVVGATGVFRATDADEIQAVPVPAIPPVAAASRVIAAADVVTRPALPADPRELLRRGLENCLEKVQAYECVFVRRERMNGRLGDEQSIRVLYRENPKSVYMTWLTNADRVKRALYIQGQNISDEGEEQAKVEPAGAIARLFVSEVDVPIHGEEARKAGRYTIDQFGFSAVLARMIRDNDRFAKLGGLSWNYEGTSTIDQRPTIVLVRSLPYEGADGRFPDARLVVHLDREWLCPVAIFSYADPARSILLGSYLTTQVRLNPTITGESFRF